MRGLDIRLVLAFTGEGELVLGLSIGDLVDTEPLVGSTEEPREVALDVLDIVELGSQRILDVDDDDLPVSLLLIKQSHDTEDLDLLDLTGVADELTNLADVKRVVVTLGLGLRVDRVGVLPGLQQNNRVSHSLDGIMTGRAEQAAKPEAVYLPEGRHRSSRGSPCGGSSFGRIEACPS